MTRIILIASTITLIAVGTFIYSAVNTLCDDDYWPDW